eukprot:scaffold120125_cov54-Phaeocystis_antarctica.AAC.2
MHWGREGVRPGCGRLGFKVPMLCLARLDTREPRTGRLDSVVLRPLKSCAHHLQLERVVVRGPLLLGSRARGCHRPHVGLYDDDPLASIHITPN